MIGVFTRSKTSHNPISPYYKTKSGLYKARLKTSKKQQANICGAHSADQGRQCAWFEGLAVLYSLVQPHATLARPGSLLIVALVAGNQPITAQYPHHVTSRVSGASRNRSI